MTSTPALEFMKLSVGHRLAADYRFDVQVVCGRARLSITMVSGKLVESKLFVDGIV